MKRPYLASGTLVENAKKQSNLFAVDASLFTYLSGLLNGDYCYLTIAEEVVRVLSTQAPNQLLVSRAVEGLRGEYLAGESIKYSVTKSELVDATTASVLSLSVTGAIKYSAGILEYPKVKLFGLGGLLIDDWLIQDIPDNAGCCAANNDPEPIPLQYEKYRLVTGGRYRKVTSGNFRAYL